MVTIVVSEEVSSGTNGFDCNHGNEETGECYSHGSVDKFLCKINFVVLR